MKKTAVRNVQPFFVGKAARYGPPKILAADAAHLAENLPNGAAVGITAAVKYKETHFADLLVRICIAITVWIVTEL